VDWVHDAAAVLDALGLASAAVMGISGGGPFAAACAAALPSRVRCLVLVSSLGMVEWGTDGMASGERVSLAVAQHVPGFGGWFLGRLAQLARTAPRLFIKIVTIELAQVDRDALQQGEECDVFIESYREAFRRGSAGAAQDLRLLTRPWGFALGSIRAPTWVHHGEADTTVPPEHAERFASAIPTARLQLHPGHGHFSLLPHAVRQTLVELRDL
jgi:pimeloyl-ACP methyl ester carboxylesterase